MTLSPRMHFHGMVGGHVKNALLNASRGLVFPVRWHEPFGLAIIESMYFGCPVFATPYGAIPELIPAECGVLSASQAVLVNAIQHNTFDPEICHQHAVTQFNAHNMAIGYLEKYQQVLAGMPLNLTAPQLATNAMMLPWS